MIMTKPITDLSEQRTEIQLPRKEVKHRRDCTLFIFPLQSAPLRLDHTWTKIKLPLEQI